MPFRSWALAGKMRVTRRSHRVSCVPDIPEPDWKVASCACGGQNKELNSLLVSRIAREIWIAGLCGSVSGLFLPLELPSSRSLGCYQLCLGPYFFTRRVPEISPS